MTTADTAQVISAAPAGIAAIAAAGSALLSRSAVERGNFAFVWPELEITEARDAGTAVRVRVRLHSDGPGLALYVRCSIYFAPEPGRLGERAAEEEEEEEAVAAKPVVRALRPGESSPPYEFSVDPQLRDQPWGIVARWSDTAGRRWQFSEPGGRELASMRRRVRQARW